MMGSQFRSEQIDGMNCFEAPSDLTLPASHKMMCGCQVCYQRYLADLVIRGANASYKKPGMNVAQVRSKDMCSFSPLWKANSICVKPQRNQNTKHVKHQGQ